MHIIKLRVAARIGNNGMPSFGDVSFDDGKAYTFLLLPDGSYSLSGWRKRHGVTESFSITSPKRSTAVLSYLNR